FGDVAVAEEAIHVQPDGKKLLVIHGDQFDGIVRYARWLAIMGDWAYNTALRINTMFNWARRKLGLDYWSLSAYLKNKAKNAVQFIANYEQAVAGEARRRGVDGVVCGHIHHAEIREIDGILYCNDATGSRAAPRSSRISTAACASCAGPRNRRASNRCCALCAGEAAAE